MFIVERVEIDGLWRQLKLATDLHPDVNIFIGPNASGKTTFISILQATLTVDLDLIASLQFEEVRMTLRAGRTRRRISVRKITSDIAYDIIRYRLGNTVIQLPLLPRDAEYRRLRAHTRFAEELANLRKRTSELVNISWLSVHREILESEYRDYRIFREYTEHRDPRAQTPTFAGNPVDRRLQELMARLTRYQLQLQSKAKDLSDNLDKQILASMLYDPEFDTWAAWRGKRVDLRTVKRGLLKAYRDLGVLDAEQDIETRIVNHIEKLRHAIGRVRDWDRGQKVQLSVDDIMPVSLLRRTEHIVELSTAVDREKRKIAKPVELYLDTLRQFATDKTFELDPSRAGELLVTKETSRVAMEQLSSGEKQLTILLTETLLQMGERFVFIADEPELSLHIQWQRRILSAIRMLNSKAQIIVATHSPEIAAKWRERIINMESIIHG